MLSIAAFGAMSVVLPGELASGDPLARALCGYVGVFWGVRLALQAVLDVKEHLGTWWLKAGYHALTVAFLYFSAVFAWAALGTAAS